MKPRTSAKAVLKEVVLPIAAALAGAAFGFLFAALIILSAIGTARAAWQGRRRDSALMGGICVLLLLTPFVAVSIYAKDMRGGGDDKAWIAALHEGLDHEDVEDRMQRFADDLEAGQLSATGLDGQRIADSLDTRLVLQIGVRPWLYWHHRDSVTDEIGLDDLFPVSDILTAEQILYLRHRDDQGPELESFRMLACFFGKDGQPLRVTPVSPGFFRNVLDDERYVTLVDTCSRARTMLTTGDLAMADRAADPV